MLGWTASSWLGVLSRWRLKLLRPGMKNEVEIIEFQSDHDTVTRCSGFRPIAMPRRCHTERIDARLTHSTAPGQDPCLSIERSWNCRSAMTACEGEVPVGTRVE